MPKASAKKARKIKTKPFDVADYLRTPEDMAAYLDAWLEETPDDAAGIARALGNIALGQGDGSGRERPGVSRESLYRALSTKGNPSLATILKVTKALGVKLHVQAA